MNLFSQSNLALKLKKTNNLLLSTSQANDYQKPTISDSLKSQNLINNSMISESDSFVEILHTSQSNKSQQITMSQNVFKSSPINQNITNEINENRQCPVCLQMVDTKNFIIHVKSCGTSYKLTSEVLIKAVDLQERQTAEREALGLPKLIKSKDLKKKKCDAKKQTKLKIGTDSNLDLAIAMSVSLQESKHAEIIKESETLLDAGLENEAIEKRKTLENFGFISKQPIKSKLRNFSKANSKLFNQTREDREKIITEKVAMILLDIDSNTSSEMCVHHERINLRSEYLNKIRNNDNKLWKMSLLEEQNISKYYVNNLSKFILPCDSNSFTNLNNCFTTSEHQSLEKTEPNIINNESMDTSHTIIDDSNTDNISATSIDVVRNKSISEYSSKWKSMVGNQFMSDITIFTKDKCEIPAHSLVFHAQYANILDDIIIEESSTHKTKKIIMWLEFSYKACWAFLEFIYSGQEPFVSMKYRNDYLHLGEKYNIIMALNYNENNGWFDREENNVLKRKNTKLFNSPVDCKKYRASSPDMFIPDNDMTPFLGITVNDEKSLSVMKTKQWLNDCNISQHYNLSFTENLINNLPQETSLSGNSPSHSFHSASTISVPLSSMSEKNAQESIELINALHFINSSSSSSTSSLTDKSSIKIIPLSDKINVSNSSVYLAKKTTLQKSYKEPEVITINSDSESLDMDITIKINEHVALLPKLNTEIEKKCDSLKKTTNATIIDLCDDNSSNSIHSASTNILNTNSKLHHSLFHDFSVLNSRVSTTKNNEDDNSVFSAVTNLLHRNNFNTQRASFSDIIHLDDNSSDSIIPGNMSTLLKIDSLPTIIPMNITQSNCSNIDSISFSNNLSPKKTNISMNLITDNNSPSKSNLLTDFEFSNSNISTINTKLKSIKDFDIELNDKNDKIFSNEKNILNKSYLDSNLLEKEKILPNNYSEDECITKKKYFDLANECTKKQTLIKPINNEIGPMQSSDINNISQTTALTKNNIHDHSGFEQIIEDPWMDYNDWQSFNISPQYFSPRFSDSTSAALINKTEQQTPPKNNVCLINLNSQTQSISCTQKINAITPNKYGSKIKTPKSLRKVQSESIIGSKEQVTPLPDYSVMKTPDLRKEFDRYGLKDLGRRKGKLILRHIYDVLHPLHNSEDDRLISLNGHYDSSDSSDNGIPEYEGGSNDELETLSQNNLLNKISIDIGFVQLLKSNKELHRKILFYEPIWIEELKENLKEYNVNISMQKLMSFLDDKCVTFRSKLLTDQRQKTLSKKSTKRKKLF